MMRIVKCSDFAQLRIINDQMHPSSSSFIRDRGSVQVCADFYFLKQGLAELQNEGQPHPPISART